MGKLVNQTELSEILGVTDVTIWQWQKEGLPIKVQNLRGQSNEYDTSDVVRWMVERATKKASGGETQDQRLKRVQADKVEMEVAQMRRELVPAEDIEARWASLIISARKKLLSMPAQLTELLETAEGTAAKRALLMDEIDKVLAELSGHDDAERILEDYVRRVFERVAQESAASGGDPGTLEVGAAASPAGLGVGGGETVPQREELGLPGAVPAGDGALPASAAGVPDTL